MRHASFATHHRVAALGLLALFLCALPMARAANHYVTQCGDYLPGDPPIAGTLRTVIAGANSGDTVLLTDLPASCERIALKAPIQINQTKLTLVGKVVTAFPSGERFWFGILDGQDQHQALIHASSGELLTIKDMRIEHDYASPAGASAKGGCIQAAGDLILEDSWVESCQAEAAPGQLALGGAIHAFGQIELHDSTIRDARALAVNKASEGGHCIQERWC